MKLGEILVHAQDFFMLNRLLHLGLRRISFFLLFDEFLNFRGVQARRCATIVFHISVLSLSLDLGLDVTISQILLLKDQLRILPPKRRVVERGLHRSRILFRAIGALIQSCADLGALFLG